MQVRDLLVQRIVTGEWTPGSAIPNETQLAQELTVSLGTVRKALEAMEAEQIIIRKQGRSTFVSDHSSAEMSIRFSNVCTEQGVRLEGTILPQNAERGKVTEYEAAVLHLARTSEVWRIERHHSAHGRLFMIEQSVLPVLRFPKFSEDDANYRICVLAQKNRLLLRNAVEMLTIEHAGDLGAVLNCPAEQPLLVMDRTIYAIDGRPIEWRVARCDLQNLHYVSQIA